MPRISSFYGITILMFFGDHNSPTSTLATEGAELISAP